MIFGRDDHQKLLDVVAGEKPFGRVQPHRLISQRGERLFVVLVVKPAALAGSRHHDGKFGHVLASRPYGFERDETIVDFRQTSSGGGRAAVGQLDPASSGWPRCRSRRTSRLRQEASFARVSARQVKLRALRHPDESVRATPITKLTH